MAYLSSILEEKGNETVRVNPEASVEECLRLMKEKNIGSVLVMENDKVCGIFTECVAVREVYLNLKNLDLNKTSVKDVMQTPIIVNPETTIYQAMEIFTRERTRHLPVVKNSKLLGIVSIGDVTKWIIEQQKNEIEHLSDYISGEPHEG